jgi:hypothetical protein
VIDERSELVYNLLFNDKKTFTFLHGKSGKEDDQETEDGLSDEKAFIYQFDEKNTEIKSQHLDTKLQTRLTPKGCKLDYLICITTPKRLKRSKAQTFFSWHWAH